MTEPLPSEHDCGSGQPPGTGAIVDQAVGAAARTLFEAADVPLARAGELLAALQGPAMRAVMAMRIEQIVKHGHSAENDAMLPILWLPRQAREHAQIAWERIGVTGAGRNLANAKRHLAIAAALCLASIDRIDAAIANQEG